MNIVITGGTSGIGQSLVEKFVLKGDNVIVLARGIDEGEIKKSFLDDFKKRIENDKTIKSKLKTKKINKIELAKTTNSLLYGIKCDVSKNQEIISAFNIIKEKFGKVDMLINNAGYGVSGATELIKEEEARRIFDVDFFGVLFCIQSCLPLMEKNAKIINISSACALFALPFRSLYCASKSATSMLSNSIRLELLPANIQVCAICPGDIKTNFTKNRSKNFETNNRYGDRIKNATDKIDSKENKRMPLSYASKKIFKITQKQNLKPQYIIGKKYKLLYFFSKILPLNLMLKATGKMMGGHK